MPEKITEEMILAQVLSYPGVEKILSKHRFPCLRCHVAAYEIGILKLDEVTSYNRT